MRRGSHRGARTAPPPFPATAEPAAALWSPGAARTGRGTRSRLAALLDTDPGGRSRPRTPSWPDGPKGAWRRLPRAVATALGAVGLGTAVADGPAGWLLGLAAACALWRVLPNRPDGSAAADAERRAAAQVPVVAELLAACLAAGSGPVEAADAVGRSVGGPLGERLVHASTELRLGGEPSAAWGRLGELPGAAALARCLERSGTSGAPVAEPMNRLAAECRARRARAATVRARRAAVLVTGPLGLCFLPAFLLAGVVPVVVGLARSLL